MKTETTPHVEKLRASHVQRMESEGRQTLERFVQQESGKIKAVKWQDLVAANQRFTEKASDGVNDETYSDLLRYLEIKGVLCHEYSGFFLFASGLDVSPSDGNIKYHFAGKDDATAYMRAKFANAQYPVKVARIED